MYPEVWSHLLCGTDYHPFSVTDPNPTKDRIEPFRDGPFLRPSVPPTPSLGPSCLAPRPLDSGGGRTPRTYSTDTSPLRSVRSRPTRTGPFGFLWDQDVGVLGSSGSGLGFCRSRTSDTNVSGGEGRGGTGCSYETDWTFPRTVFSPDIPSSSGNSVEPDRAGWTRRYWEGRRDPRRGAPPYISSPT